MHEDCQLFREFIDGVKILNHAELFGIGNTLIQIMAEECDSFVDKEVSLGRVATTEMVRLLRRFFANQGEFRAVCRRHTREIST